MFFFAVAVIYEKREYLRIFLHIFHRLQIFIQSDRRMTDEHIRKKMAVKVFAKLTEKNGDQANEFEQYGITRVQKGKIICKRIINKCYVDSTCIALSSLGNH